MATDLIKKEITPSEVFVPNGLDLVIAAIKQEKAKFEKDKYDMGEESHRKKVASFAYQITRSKTYVDGKGKEYVAELKEKPKIVDAERKRFRDIMDELVSETRKELTEWEEAEKARIEAERQHEIYLMDWDEALKEDDIFNREREIKRKEAEFARIEEEHRRKEETDRIEEERIAREEQIKEEAEERAAFEAQEKIEYAIKKAQEDAEKAERDRMAAEERAKLEAERAEKARIDALKKAEEDKLYAVKKAQQAAAMDARLKKEAEDREAARIKAEADKKAANKEHQKKINNNIKDSLSAFGIDSETAKALIVAIAKNEIPYIKILY